MTGTVPAETVPFFSLSLGKQRPEIRERTLPLQTNADVRGERYDIARHGKDDFHDRIAAQVPGNIGGQHERGKRQIGKSEEGVLGNFRFVKQLMRPEKTGLSEKSEKQPEPPHPQGKFSGPSKGARKRLNGTSLDDKINVKTFCPLGPRPALDALPTLRISAR